MWDVISYNCYNELEKTSFQRENLFDSAVLEVD